METTIPFSGFYESIHNYQIDSAIESIVMLDDNCEVVCSLRELLFDAIDFRAVHEGYAREYLDWLCSEYSFQAKSICLDSPNYYNFSTDRIIAEIELSEIERIFSLVDKDKLEDKIKERFTSRSGFISFYDNSLDAWPESLDQWDANQVGTLVECYLDQEQRTSTSAEELFYYDASEICWSLISENSDSVIYERVNKIREYLNKRNERRKQNEQ